MLEETIARLVGVIQSVCPPDLKGLKFRTAQVAASAPRAIIPLNPEAMVERDRYVGDDPGSGVGGSARVFETIENVANSNL